MAQKCECGLTAAAVHLEMLKEINVDFLMLGEK
ncbi:MAG: hypothetical protein ACJAU1_000921 [Psychromonas sp.]|jgi:hypothetical protein